MERWATLEVLLLPRPNDDPIWPNLLNLPGKMFRTIDFKRIDNTPMNGPFERIQSGELNVKFTKEPEFAGIAFQKTDRGPIVALVYLGTLPEDANLSDEFVWCDVDKLKKLKNLLQTEMSAIQIALKKFILQ